MNRKMQPKSIFQHSGEWHNVKRSVLLGGVIIIVCLWMGYHFGKDCAMRDNHKGFPCVIYKPSR